MLGPRPPPATHGPHPWAGLRGQVALLLLLLSLTLAVSTAAASPSPPSSRPSDRPPHSRLAPKFRLVASRNRRPSQFYFIAEVSDVADALRTAEIAGAIRGTLGANPTARFIILTSETNATSVRRRLLSLLRNVSFDMYYTSEVVYGSLFEVGNAYPGLKIAGSADDLYPAVNFECEMRHPPMIYAISRIDTTESSGFAAGCRHNMNEGGIDAILFERIPGDVLPNLRYSRAFWGAENVAAWLLTHHGFTFHSLCPYYAPIHLHNPHASPRNFRIRINGHHSDFPSSRWTTKYCRFRGL